MCRTHYDAICKKSRLHSNDSSSSNDDNNNIQALKPHRKHKPIPHRNNNHKRNNTRRYTTRKEMLNIQIALAGALVFHHDGSCSTATSVQLHKGDYKDSNKEREGLGFTYSY